MVTDQQIRRLFKLLKTEETQEIAASKAGMDLKTARKYLKARRLPSEMKTARHWRTRPDEFAAVWPEISEQLRTNPALEAKTIFEAMKRQYPERFADGQLRTLQRRIKTWRATEGPAQEVYFVQEHRPGEPCESDFTHLRELGITIVGEPFAHMLYHFVLTYSNWEAGTICQSESFASLSEGLQNALGAWRSAADAPHRSYDVGGEQPDRAGRVPEELPVAAPSLRPGRAQDPNRPAQRKRRYRAAALPASTLEQALLLRGSRDFAD
jgi:hypothetical protein